MRKMTKREQLVLYRSVEKDKLLAKMESVMLQYDEYNKEDDWIYWETNTALGDYCSCIYELIERTAGYGF